MFIIFPLKCLINSGLIILINPARQTNPFFCVTPCFSKIETIFLSYSQLPPLIPTLSIISVLTPSFCAILTPFASGLFDITTTGFIGILSFLIDFKIAYMLLQRPEINMPRLIIPDLFLCVNKHFTEYMLKFCIY